MRTAWLIQSIVPHSDGDTRVMVGTSERGLNKEYGSENEGRYGCRASGSGEVVMFGSGGQGRVKEGKAVCSACKACLPFVFS